MRIGLVIIFVLVSTPVNAQDRIALLTGAGLDLGTTFYALQDSSLHEGNPLAGNKPGIVGLKLAGTSVVLLGTNYIKRAGHPKLAKSINYAFAIFWGGVAFNNVRLTR